MTQTHTLFDAALSYAAKGLMSSPYTPFADGCSCKQHKAFPDRQTSALAQKICSMVLRMRPFAATITRWWTRCKVANIGIRTGAVSGLSVLDVDFLVGWGREPRDPASRLPAPRDRAAAHRQRPALLLCPSRESPSRTGSRTLRLGSISEAMAAT